MVAELGGDHLGDDAGTEQDEHHRARELGDELPVSPLRAGCPATGHLLEAALCAFPDPGSEHALCSIHCRK
ncbi:hypothetical protein ACFQQB_06555 [Nonomuraea rubra]|uniref:hypothetical protein n=1 Tax=Nonomuraea rubra TaxID=46180 RepID=UPI00360BE128